MRENCEVFAERFKGFLEVCGMRVFYSIQSKNEKKNEKKKNKIKENFQQVPKGSIESIQQLAIILL